mgnify:CR=1 FL=1
MSARRACSSCDLLPTVQGSVWRLAQRHLFGLNDLDELRNISFKGDRVDDCSHTEVQDRFRGKPQAIRGLPFLSISLLVWKNVRQLWWQKVGNVLEPGVEMDSGHLHLVS